MGQFRLNLSSKLDVTDYKKNISDLELAKDIAITRKDEISMLSEFLEKQKKVFTKYSRIKEWNRGGIDAMLGIEVDFIAYRNRFLDEFIADVQDLIIEEQNKLINP